MADFKAGDKIPVFSVDSTEEHVFSGRRIKRGLYRYGDGSTGNADINGAANIIRKVFPNVKGWDKGIVDPPICCDSCVKQPPQNYLHVKTCNIETPSDVSRLRVVHV